MIKSKSKSKAPVKSQVLNVALLTGAIVLGLGTIGWLVSIYLRPPTIQVVDLKYLQLMRTAVSNRSLQAVVKLETILKKKLDAGELSASQWNHFETILNLAQAGSWDEADEACRNFETAQQYRSR